MRYLDFFTNSFKIKLVSDKVLRTNMIISAWVFYLCVANDFLHFLRWLYRLLSSHWRSHYKSRSPETNRLITLRKLARHDQQLRLGFHPPNGATFQGLHVTNNSGHSIQTKLSSFKIKRSLSPETTFKTSDINKLILSTLHRRKVLIKLQITTSVCGRKDKTLSLSLPLPCLITESTSL